MSSLKDRISPADPANPFLRVTLYTALALLCKGAEILSRLPGLETALEAGDRERFRLLSASEAALGWLVGQGAEDSVDDLSRESALGDAAAVLDWSDEEAERHFSAALADFREEGVMAGESLIRDMPPEERRRQRFLRGGAEALSDAEVLSLVLGTGSRDVCPLELARAVLEERGGLFGLVGVSPEVLRRRGLGEAKAASLLASVELARRLAHQEVPKRQPLGCPGAVVRYLVLRYASLGQEVVGALYIDGRNRLIGDQAIYRGTLSRASVEPREVFHLHPLILRHSGGSCILESPDGSRLCTPP